MLKRLFILLFILLGAVSQSFATHLVGGSMSYEYKGKLANGESTFKVTFVLYRDCSGTGTDDGKPVPFDLDIDICVYSNSGSKPFYNKYKTDLVSEEKVQPLGRTDCPQTKNMCLSKGVYERIIVVAPSSFGYVLFWQRCCRNVLTNLPEDPSGVPDLGQSYSATIPPTNQLNSSPYFSGVPVPFICVNDLTELRNTAIDPDGDDLEYRFVTPWDGKLNGASEPTCPTSYTTPKNVVYTSGYSTGQPFGANGTATINSANGLTKFLATAPGSYAVALEVIERRNGVELSRVRLELQILVVNCTPNNKPVIQGGDNQIYTIEAGANLCFDIVATDLDNQNIKLSAYGDILSGTNGFTGTRASFTTKTGYKSVSSQFCWQTDCQHARTDPYLLTAEAIDDGCPSKFTNVNFLIYVKPFISDIDISGINQVCNNAQNQIYSSVNRQPSSKLTWSTSANGTINGSNTGSNLSVNWNGGTEGKIYVTEISQYNCFGSKDSFVVTLISAPPNVKISGKLDVCPNSLEDYVLSDVLAGHTVQWFVKGGAITFGKFGFVATINWGGKGTAEIKAVQYNQFGCASDTAKLIITIHKPDPPIIEGVQSICPYIQNVPYNIQNPLPAHVYMWSVTPTGVLASGQGTDKIKINWGNIGRRYVKAIAIDQYNCPSDEDSIPVDIEYVLLGEIPDGLSSVCEENEIEYKVRFTPKSIYRWTVSGGNIIEGDTGNIIKVKWGVAGNGQVAVFEESYDTINNRPCLSLTNILPVVIHPNPIATEIEGVFEICQLAGGFNNFTLNGYANSYYKWSIDGDTSNIIGQGTRTIRIPLDKEGTFVIGVLETTEFGCPGVFIDSVFIVHPKPRTTPILGDNIICYPYYDNKPYSVTGFNTSTFKWFVDGGVEVPAPSITASTIVNWSGQQNANIKVLETSDFGCLGDTQSLPVFADKPSIKFDLVTVNPPPGSDQSMKVYWTLNNGPRYNRYFLIYKRNAGSSDAFVLVDSVIGSRRDYTESPLNTDNNAFEYKVLGYDLCGQRLLSDSHTNVLLTGVKDGPYEVTLGFSGYNGWNEGVSEYQLYRYLPSKTGWQFLKSYPAVQSNIKLDNGLDNYTQCYRIKAIKNVGGQDTASWSNELCFDFDPAVWIPNAFTRNADGLNDKFFVTAGAVKTIEITVFNRWGEKLYRSTDQTEGWDGTYKGENCQQDVYMYVVRFTDFLDKNYMQSGTLHLIR